MLSSLAAELVKVYITGDVLNEGTLVRVLC